MVSRYMVLFGITYLRLDIFITWWMSIFQSTVVLRHFASLSVHHCILGHTPSPRASDLPQVSFTFRSSCWPLRVAYWGIPSFPGIIGPFIGFIIFGPSSRSSWVVILGHIPSDRVCLHHYMGYPLVLGHLIRSFIILSVWVQFESGPHLYRSVLFHVSLSFRGRTYINRSSSCQFEFSLSQGRTYIDWSFSVLVWVFGAAPISISHHLVSSSSVWVGTAPISIGHFPY